MTTPANNAVETTETNAAAAAPAAPAVPSKMDKSKVVFAGLRDGSIPLAEGKSARATFIAMVQEPEIGATKNGAATYWQNLVSLEKGGKLYPHTSTKKTAEAKPADAAPADAAPAAETTENEGGEAKDQDDVSHLAE